MDAAHPHRMRPTRRDEPAGGSPDGRDAEGRIQPDGRPDREASAPDGPAPTDPAAPAPAQLVPLDPRVRLMWWTTGALQVVLVVLVVSPIDFLVTLPVPDGTLTLLVAAAFGTIHAVVPVLRFRRWRYALREHDLWIRRGVLWVTVSVIPFARLQFVDTRQGPLDRLFGLSQLVVHTAALGTSGRLPGLDSAVAERLRERLAAVEQGEAASV